MIIQISKNKNSFEYFNSFLNFLNKIDAFFEPPLSSRVTLETYAQKLLEEAYIDVILENDEIIAACAYYCTAEDYDCAFLSLIVSLQKGLGGLLIEQMINNCKKLGAKGIETQTWETNSKSLKLFQRFNFEKVSYLDNRNSSTKSILLKLKFDD